MPSQSSAMRQVAALSLDGGGLLALSELYTIREVMQRVEYVLELNSTPLPCEQFDVIGGSGSGGIIALLLGRLRMTVDEAIEAFIRLYQALYGQITPQESLAADHFELSLSYLFQLYNKFYGSAPHDTIVQYPISTENFIAAMKALIETHIPNHDPEATLLEENSPCRTFVCAMPSIALTGRNPVRLFRNYRPRQDASFNCTIWEAALATTAHPQFFKPIQIGPLSNTQSYIDAGYGYNNPVKQVIEQTHAIFAVSESTYCFLSLGAGFPGVLGQPNSSSDPEWASVLDAIATDCERIAEQMDRIAQQGYIRINVEQGLQGNQLADWVNPGEIATHTIGHLNQYSVSSAVDEVVDALVRRYRESLGGLRSSEASVLPIEKLLMSVPQITTKNDLKLAKTIVKRQSCRFHVARITYKKQQRDVVVQIFYGPRRLEHRNAALYSSMQSMAPGFLKPFLLSADYLDDPFIVYNENFLPAERQLSAALAKSDTGSLARQGMVLISNLSSALEFLEMKAKDFQHAQLRTRPEDFLVFAQSSERFLIAFSPCAEGEMIDASKSGVNVALLENICAKTVTAATLIYFRNKLDQSLIYTSESLEEAEVEESAGIMNEFEGNPESRDVLLDNTAAVPSHRYTSNLSDVVFRMAEAEVEAQLPPELPKIPQPLTRNTPALKEEPDRRIFSWQSHPNKDLTLRKIADEYSELEETQEPSLPYSSLVHSPLRRKANCPGYRRDEIRLALSYTSTRILVHESPFPQEVCAACGEEHKELPVPSICERGVDDTPCYHMTSDALGRGLFVLSFDHGNIAGHSPLYLIQEIMGRLNSNVEKKNECIKWRQTHKRSIRPHDVFDIIGGSGTGGIIAGMLSSMQLDVTHTLKEYLGLAGLLFPDPFSSRSASTLTSKLENAIKRLIKSHHPSRNKHTPLIGTPADSSDGFILAHHSINVLSWPAIFRTYRAQNPQDVIDCELWQALRATTADLGAGKFEEVVIKNQKYSGTSIKNGNPTQHLSTEIRQRFPTREVDLVLSLGCGLSETISLPKGTSKNVEKTLTALNKDCERTNELMYWYWSHQALNAHGTDPYRRLNVTRGMQKMDGVSYSAGICETVALHTKQYIAQADVSREIDHIVGVLEKRMIQKELELHSDLPRLPKLPFPVPVSTPIYPAPDRKKLLSLDGGGLMGISEMLLLDRILDGDDKKPCEYFDLIGGCGTGGILAIFLARFEMTINEAMVTLERTICPLLPFIKNDDTQDTKKLTSVFEKELGKVLTELSGENFPTMFPASPQKCKAFVLAHSLDNLTQGLHFFGTYKEGERSMSKTNILIQDAIRVTTASRNLFLDAIFGEGNLVERFGGTDNINSNPTVHLIQEAERIWPASPAPFVVSLGAGQVGTIPHPRSRGKRGLLEILYKISSACEDTHEKVKMLLPPELYHRFNVQHGLSDKELWSLMEIERVKSSTKAYCESVVVSSRLESVGEVLDEAIGEKVAQGNEADN